MSRTESPKKLSKEHLAIVREMSDRELYPEAVAFVAKNCPDRLPRPAQLQGCLQFSQDIKDWTDFVRNQVERPSHADVEFYRAIRNWNQGLTKRLQALKLTEGQPPADAKKTLDALASAVAGEFVRHLVAECRYQDKLRREDDRAY